MRTVPARVIVAALAIVMLGLPVGALAQDGDGDGIPDAVEERLGTDPRLAEELRLVLDDGASGAGDKNINAAHKLANDVVQCFVGHVGENRYVFKITLAEAFNADGTVFHVYVDWDNDHSNGRQDADWVRGVDAMYSTVRGSFGPRLFTPEVRASAELPPRWVVDGDTVYVCDDVKAKIVDGKTQFRLYLLSHMADNTSDSDSTVWATVTVPVDPGRKAPVPPVPVRANFDVLPADWELVGQVGQAPGALLLRPVAEDVVGYELWHDGSVASQGVAGERAVMSVPRAGRYHVACVVYGSGGPYPGIDVSINDRPLGVAAAATAGAGDLLLFSTEPAELKAGDKLTFSTAKNSTGYRVGSFMLVTKRPAMPELRIDGPQVWHMPDEPGKPPGRVQVSWRTNRPTTCTVHYALAGPEAYVEEGDIETQPGGNQRAFYVTLDRRGFRASRYALKIQARENDLGAYWKGQQAEASVVVEMAPPEPGGEQPGEIELTVAEPAATGRLWPMRSGVPIPRGRLWDAQRCELRGRDDKPVEAQLVGWSYWPDRSVRWLIVDFLAQTQAGKEAKYRLRYGVDARPVTPALRIVQGDGGLVVEGRRLRLEMPDDAPLGRVWADKDGDGKASEAEVAVAAAPLVLTGPDYKRYVAGTPDETTVLEDGPLHAMVRRAGWFVGEDGSKPFRYMVVAHVWRDLPRLYLEVSLDTANVETDMSLLSRLALELPMAGDAVWLGEVEPRPLSDGTVRLLQDHDNRYLVNGEQAGERHAGGVAVMRAGSPVVLAAVRDFWKVWPKGFTATKAGLAVDLLPELPADAYQSAEDQELVDRLFFWCDGGKYKLRAGTRVTSEVLLDFGAPGETDALAAETGHVSAPLFAACTTKHYCESGAMGSLYPRDGKTFPRYDENAEWSFDDLMKRQGSVREYGFINYGDWYGERQWNWGNIEYDTQWALALEFAHNGRLDMLWRGEAAAKHNADVDTVHYSRDPRQVGKVHIHCLCHTGSYFGADWRDGGGIRGGSGHCHTWTQGQLVYGALLGDYRLRDTGRLIASEIVTARSPACPFYARDAGWTVISMLAAYEDSGDPWYLEGARLMVDRMLQRQDPVSGAMGSHFLDPSECKHRPQHYGPKPFMTGVMMRGLRMYDQTEPREDVKRAIVRCADWMWNEAWVAKDRGFWYSACPTFTSKGGTWTFSLVGDGLGYACLVDEEHRARRLGLLEEACAAHLYEAGRSGFGKSFTQETCCMLYALEWLRQMGVTDLQAPPKQEVRATLALRSVLVMQPGEKRVVRPFLVNPSDREVRVEVRVREAPDGVQVAPPQPCTVSPQARADLALGFTCRPDATPGQTGTASVQFRLGGVSDTREIRVLVARPEELGDGVGIITGRNDHFAAALAKVGLSARPVAEASWEQLQGLRALVVGDEALYYNFADLRDHLADLQRFVLSGGTLVVGQLNDQEWDTGMLPWDLWLDEPETATGDVLEPKHGLFAGVDAEGLQGIVSYDSIVGAAPEWRVLMTDTAGRPSVLEADFGRGKVLVIEPSFDRPVVDPEDAHAGRASECTAFLGRVAWYLAR